MQIKGGKIHEPSEGSKIGYRHESKGCGGCAASGPALCFQLGKWQDQSFPGKSEILGIRIAGPSADEINELMKKASTLPDLQYQMAESFLQFLIALHEGGRIRYAELAMLEDYIEFLATQV